MVSAARQHSHPPDQTGDVGTSREAGLSCAGGELRAASIDVRRIATLTVFEREEGRAPSPSSSGGASSPKFSCDCSAHDRRDADPFRRRMRHQRGLQTTHVDTDEVVGDVAHEPANDNERSEL